MKKVLFVLLLVSTIMNAGLISGWVRIGSPEEATQTAYIDSQRDLMTALIDKENQ